MILIEEGVTGKILKFADDNKLFRKVKDIGDNQIYKMTSNQIKSILFIHRNFRKRFRGVYSAKNQLILK